jgi:transposase InsO family protein
MPGGPESKLLLVFVDTFTGWVEAFPCRSERAREVVRVLITEIIPCFGLPKSLQSDNGPAFKAEVTQGLSRALGIEYHLHCAWRPQSSGKVEKTNELLKRHLAKLAQETYSPGPSSSLLLSSGSETLQASRD